jgi:hypothetical protein
LTVPCDRSVIFSKYSVFLLQNNRRSVERSIKHHKPLMLFHYIENIAFNGTASRSSDYYWKDKMTNLTADLAITCEPTYCMYFSSAWCATILHSPMQSVAWWMLMFPVDTMYITNVQMYHRSASKINLPFKKNNCISI